MKNQKNSRKNTGQLAIFIILLFPVLFTLFAMSLNITLVVHDKINLQNSVDIAAYYGAMKQAEMLNAIAHINYQIRQSWKLMTWRYRVLGNIGLTNVPIWKPALPVENREHSLPAFHPTTVPGPYFFCVGHKDWGDPIQKTGGTVSTVKLEKTKDMLCHKMLQDIKAPSVPTLSGTLGSLSSALNKIRATGLKIQEQLKEHCDIYGYNSWLLGAWTFRHFHMDQSARKKMIYHLAETMSGRPDHLYGTDLDGKSIEKGVLKTFKKNLTFINRKAFEEEPKKSFKQFNSLKGKNPKEWLKDIPLYHLGLFGNFKGSKTNCQKNLDYLRNGPAAASNHDILQLTQILNTNKNPWPDCKNDFFCAPSAGLYKNKNFMIFYTVKADLKYKNQIFLPSFGADKVNLKAKAFAKPFGGTIGPMQPKKADPRLPKPKNGGQSPSGNLMELDKKFTPNYSRYPGDEYGLRSPYVHYYWANHIKSTNRNEKNILFYSKDNYHDDRDPLARGLIPPGLGILARKWELVAISPDIFDVTYFTILPYYMQTHFPKIKNLFEEAGGETANSLRGDLGTFRDTNNNFYRSGILEQTGVSTHIQPPWIQIRSHVPPPPVPKPWYKIGNLDQLLTGWNPPTNKYQAGEFYNNIDNTKFGHCDKWGHDFFNILDGTTKGKIANGCIYGGRVGYSVKLISAEFIKGFRGLDNKIEDHLTDRDWY